MAGGGCLDLAVSTLATASGPDSASEIVHLISPPSDEPRAGGTALATNCCSNDNLRLTERELEVVRALGGGLGTREIADTLCISTATTRHHIQSIFRKLKVHNRLQAVVKAGRLGQAILTAALQLDTAGPNQGKGERT